MSDEKLEGVAFPAWSKAGARRRELANVIRSVTRRHEPPVDFGSNLKAGLGAVWGMSMVAYLAVLTGLPLLLAPLGATAALLFGQPSSPLSQPVNIMGGYLIGTIACELAFFAFPGEWVATAGAVGAAIVVMRALRVTHPPAGALPIVGFNGMVHGTQLFLVGLLSSVILIALALVVHRIPPRREYPIGNK
ncbi:HPP family protein [Aquamicrobium sp. LC103]|uniref:HPP family protein n=1 Tax=Aquamicrobium sp. LC103 TaxID=1120658 RepID=UPI0009E3DD06|nr:HPP family protein [Aquamicrobium sp. LC103]TKT80942.1 HPP family protein [Aquamicrobium sp. LC103]